MNGTDQTGDFVTSLERCLAWNMRSEQVPLEIIPNTMQLAVQSQGPVASTGDLASRPVEEAKTSTSS